MNKLLALMKNRTYKISNILDLTLKPIFSGVLIAASAYLFEDATTEPLLYIMSMTCFATAIIFVMDFVGALTPYLFRFIDNLNIKRRR